MNPFPKSGYEWPLKPDARNFPLEKAQAPQPFPEAYQTDISHIPVFFQGHIPDCVENAVTFVKKYHEWKNTGIVPDLSRRSLVIPTVQRDGFSLDEGTSVENALYVAHKAGICETQYLADDHTLTDAQFSNPAAYFPSAQVNALTHTILSYAFLQNVTSDALKNAIYQNGVVVIGAKIDKNWWTAPNGVISWSSADLFTDNGNIRTPNDPASISGHAVVLYGYDGKGFFGVNSFGTTWGRNGNFTIGYDYLPFIYECATIVDLTEAQIQTLKKAQNDAQTVQVAINHLNPNSPTTAQILPILKQILNAITAMINSIFS